LVRCGSSGVKKKKKGRASCASIRLREGSAISTGLRPIVAGSFAAPAERTVWKAETASGPTGNFPICAVR
jgi:hypothetical protein